MPEIDKEIRDQVFREARERTRANAIKRGEIRLRMSEEHIASFYELWWSWNQVFGAQVAADNLMEAMVNQHNLIRQRLTYKVEEQRNGKQRKNPSGPAE